MSRNAFVYWNIEVPTKEQIGLALTDYIGEAGEVTWDESYGCWNVSLPGHSSHPHKRLLPGSGPEVGMSPEQWIEVFPSTDHLDIITRSQSPYVDAVADGFQRFCRLHWNADTNESRWGLIAQLIERVQVWWRRIGQT